MPDPFHLLVIDDQTSDLLLIEDTLQADHPDVHLTLVQSGTDAWTHCRRGRCPDLILLDLHLPGQSGLDLLRDLKTDPATRRIPVVIYSTSAAPTDIKAAYAAHAAGFLTKPFQYTELQRVLTHLLDFWRGARTDAGQVDPLDSVAD